MARKLYDLAVKTGEYQDRDGNSKGRYENIGAIMENDKGKFMMLKRTFNPAGINSDRDNILVSLFEPRQDNRQQSGGNQQGGSRRDMDDEIPF